MLGCIRGVRRFVMRKKENRTNLVCICDMQQFTTITIKVNLLASRALVCVDDGSFVSG